MACCKCLEYNMTTGTTDAIFGEAGAEYCLFHAPAELKAISDIQFNAAIFKYMDTALSAQSEQSPVRLDGFVFPGKISFSAYNKAKPITRDIWFKGCVFKSTVQFDLTDFRKDAMFDGTRFEHNVDFHGTQFSGITTFTDCEFLWFATFTDVEISQYCEFMRCKAMENVIRLYRIKPSSLMNIMIARQEMRCMSFEDCDWPDELFEEVVGNYAPKGTEATYRSLKQKAATEHDQPMVSYWHYREKRARLKGQFKNPKAAQLFDDIEVGTTGFWGTILNTLGLVARTPGLLFSLDFWYWATSGFGERDRRAGAWLVFLIALPLLLNAIPHPIDSFPGSRLIENTLAHIPFTKDLSAKGGWLKLGQGISQLLIALQTTIFAFALRNRFRR